MPEWIENQIDVFGEPETLQRFADAVSSSGSCFDFEKILPMPRILRGTMWGKHAGVNTPAYKELERLAAARTGFKNCNDWRRATWGTASNAEHADYEVTDEAIVYRFHTAWSEPAGIARAIRDQWPDLEIDCWTWYRTEVPY